jgi:hypothetical protein
MPVAKFGAPGGPDGIPAAKFGALAGPDGMPAENPGEAGLPEDLFGEDGGTFGGVDAIVLIVFGKYRSPLDDFWSYRDVVV